MLLAVYVLLGLFVQVLIGVAIHTVYNRMKGDGPEEPEEGEKYQVFAGSAKFSSQKFVNYYLSALIPLGSENSGKQLKQAFPRWFRHRMPLPAGHIYVRAESVNGVLEFRPLPKTTILPPVIKAPALSRA